MSEKKKNKLSSKVLSNDHQVSDIIDDIVADEKEKSRKSLERFEQAIANAKASLEIEGYHLSDEMLELVRLRLKSEITEEEFINRAIIMAKKLVNN